MRVSKWSQNYFLFFVLGELRFLLLVLLFFTILLLFLWNDTKLRYKKLNLTAGGGKSLWVIINLFVQTADSFRNELPCPNTHTAVLATWERVRKSRLSQVFKMPKCSALNAH